MPITYWNLSEIGVFHHFGEQEAFLDIELLPAAHHIDICGVRKARRDLRRRLDGLEGIPGPVLIHDITCDLPSIINTLEIFRPKHIFRALNVKPVCLVKVHLFGWYSRCVPRPQLRRDAGGRGDVSFVASGDKVETDVDEVLAAKDGAAEDEVAAVEASEVLGVVLELLAGVGGEPGDVGAGSGLDEEVFY